MGFSKAQAKMYDLLDRHNREFSDLINQWPEQRSHIAYMMLGSAVAVCDSFGLDVEGWLAELRRREPKPPVLSPPKKRQS
jgi:hypothetical protein